MIRVVDLYHVLSAVVPLYVAMILAYGSVKWWKIFTPEQCSGINRFVALFAVPLLSFHFISSNNPFAMDMRFIAADTVQKVMVLAVLAVWSRASSRGSLEWSITLFSLSSLPNTLVMGIPLLKGMYGESSGTLMVQVVVLQCIVWYTLMLFLFEYRGARLLISDQFPDNTAADIVSFHVDSDVISLDGGLQADALVGPDGKLHVTVRKSTSSLSLTPRPSNLTNAEIYSLQSSRNPTPRGSSFNNKDLHMFVWSSTASPVSDLPLPLPHHTLDYSDYSFGNTGAGAGVEPVLSKLGSSSTLQLRPKEAEPAMPPASVMTRLILIMVWRKLIRNPNTYSSLIGLSWSLLSFKWNVAMPAIVAKSISILSDAGLGMAMFSLGLFMALQPRIIACGNRKAVFSMAVRFLAGPAVMAAASIAVGLKGTLLHIAIVQAALPQGIVPFVFAKEYNVHPDILSTGVIFGMLVALPITLLYYIFLGL